MAVNEGDILLNSDNEVIFKDGDVVIGNASEQHINAIIATAKGNWRKYPTLGVDLHKKIDSPTDIREIEQDAKLGLELDGYVLKELEVTTNNIDEVNISVISAEKLTDDTRGLI